MMGWLLVVSVLSAGVHLPPSDGASPIAWSTDFEESVRAARDSGKPLLLDFWASWCTPCAIMAEKVWPNPGVVAESRKFVCVSIDADNNPELAARYHAEGLPTVVFADSFGNELARLVGLHKADVMVQAMQPIPADFSPIRSFNERLERDRGNVQALVGVAGFYQKQGALAVSTRYYLRALRGMDEAGDGRTKQDVLEELGMNFLRMKSYDHAAQTFEEYLAEFPDGRRTDTVLLALLTAQLYQGQLDQAERTLAELERKYPSSTAVERGRRNLETARASRP